MKQVEFYEAFVAKHCKGMTVDFRNEMHTDLRVVQQNFWDFVAINSNDVDFALGEKWMLHLIKAIVRREQRDGRNTEIK